MKGIVEKATVASACLALLAACQAPVETEPTSVSLQPMEKPEDPGPGDIEVGERNGERVTIKVLSVEDGIMTARTSQGCQYKRDLNYGIFSPAIEWQGCAGSGEGRVEIDSMSGDIWPLEVGKSWSYDATGWTTQQWTSDMTCRVKDTARISVPAGTFDTYHVNCSTRWYAKDFYMAPENGEAVLVRQVRRNNSKASNWTWKLIETQKADAS